MTLYLIGVAVISISSCYALWTRYREEWLREELLRVYEEFVAASERGGLCEDPAFKRMQHQLLSLVKDAHYISFALIGFAVAHGAKQTESSAAESKSQELDILSQHANREIAVLIVHFLLFGTLLGLVLELCAQLMLAKEAMTEHANRLALKWVTSYESTGSNGMHCA